MKLMALTQTRGPDSIRFSQGEHISRVLTLPRSLMDWLLGDTLVELACALQASYNASKEDETNLVGFVFVCEKAHDGCDQSLLIRSGGLVNMATHHNSNNGGYFPAEENGNFWPLAAITDLRLQAIDQ